MKITYWSDFACPYCYIGNTRLKKAITELGLEDKIEFDIRAFELDQNAPKNVSSTTVERFSEKYQISIDEAKREVENISKLGQAEGIDFKYASTLYTNTFDAHRLMKYAENINPELVSVLSEKLFDAYFTKNQKLADTEVLVGICDEIGLDVRDVLKSDKYASEVRQDEEIALINGIHGVPFYLIDGKYSIPGALSYEDFKKVLTQTLSEITSSEKCEDGFCRL